MGVTVVIEALFWVIFIVLIGVNASKKAKKGGAKSYSDVVPVKETDSDEQAAQPGKMPRRNFSDRKASSKTSFEHTKKSGERESASSYLLKDDRKNDWLARQLKEEQRILRTGGIYDLGAAHEKDCQAKALKLAHIAEHDDSIDDAELE